MVEKTNGAAPLSTHFEWYPQPSSSRNITISSLPLLLRTRPVAAHTVENQHAPRTHCGKPDVVEVEDSWDPPLPGVWSRVEDGRRRSTTPAQLCFSPNARRPHKQLTSESAVKAPPLFSFEAMCPWCLAEDCIWVLPVGASLSHRASQPLRKSSFNVIIQRACSILELVSATILQSFQSSLSGLPEIRMRYSSRPCSASRLYRRICDIRPPTVPCPWETMFPAVHAALYVP